MAEKTVTAALVLIGNEILSGKTVDKNLPYITEKLNQVGVRLMEARVIPDIEQTIMQTVRTLAAGFDYVLTTGGIGPTHDDITSASIARAFDRPLIRHPEAESALRDYYGPDKINEARLKMADVPEGASLIPNPVSIAPGFQLENVYVLAGVPSICRAMVDYLAPTLQGGLPLKSVAYDVAMAEGDLAAGLQTLQARHPDIDIGVYPRYRQHTLSAHVVLQSNDYAQLQQAEGELISLLTNELKVEFDKVV